MCFYHAATFTVEMWPMWNFASLYPYQFEREPIDIWIFFYMSSELLPVVRRETCGSLKQLPITLFHDRDAYDRN